MKRFIVFESKFSARWDWQLKAENGNVIGRSAKSFASKGAATSNAISVFDGLSSAMERAELKP